MNKKSFITIKRFKLIVFVLFATFFIIISIYLLNPSKEEYIFYTQTIYEMTVPMDKEIINKICNDLNIYERQKICFTEDIIYANTFNHMLINYLNNVSKFNEKSEIDMLIGDYLIECEEFKNPKDLGCTYDFVGDDVFIIYILYDYSGMVKRVESYAPQYPL